MRDANAVREIERVLMRAESTLDDARDNLSTAATALMRIADEQLDSARLCLTPPGSYTYLIEAKRALAAGDVSQARRALDNLIEMSFILADGVNLRADLWSARCA